MPVLSKSSFSVMIATGMLIASFAFAETSLPSAPTPAKIARQVLQPDLITKPVTAQKPNAFMPSSPSFFAYPGKIRPPGSTRSNPQGQRAIASAYCMQLQ